MLSPYPFSLREVPDVGKAVATVLTGNRAEYKIFRPRCADERRGEGRGDGDKAEQRQQPRMDSPPQASGQR